MYKVKTNLKNTYLIYKIGSHHYAIESEIIRNMLGIENVIIRKGHKIFIKNKITIRNKEVTIIDLRKTLGQNTELTNETCVVVLELANSNLLYGIIVDMVVSLTDIPRNEILLPDIINYKSTHNFIKGIASPFKQNIEIIDIKKLLSFVKINTKLHTNIKEQVLLNIT